MDQSNENFALLGPDDLIFALIGHMQLVEALKNNTHF